MLLNMSVPISISLFKPYYMGVKTLFSRPSSANLTSATSSSRVTKVTYDMLVQKVSKEEAARQRRIFQVKSDIDGEVEMVLHSQQMVTFAPANTNGRSPSPTELRNAAKDKQENSTIERIGEGSPRPMATEHPDAAKVPSPAKRELRLSLTGQALGVTEAHLGRRGSKHALSVQKRASWTDIELEEPLHKPRRASVINQRSSMSKESSQVSPKQPDANLDTNGGPAASGTGKPTSKQAVKMAEAESYQPPGVPNDVEPQDAK